MMAPGAEALCASRATARGCNIDPTNALKELARQNYFRFARHSGAIRRLSFFKGPEFSGVCPFMARSLLLFQSAAQDRLASERDIKAPEKQSERSQQCDHGASSVPLVENQWW